MDDYSIHKCTGISEKKSLVSFQVFSEKQKSGISKNISTHDTNYKNLEKHLSTVKYVHAPSICEPSHAEKAWENILSFNPFHAKNLF